MVYNFNHGIGWASSGVEYAQAYRAKLLREIGVEARFIFTDMFPNDPLEHMTANIGFKDEEVIWLYSFFTDTKISPVTYTLKQLEESLGGRHYVFQRDGKIAKYIFTEKNSFYTVYLADSRGDKVHRVEMVSSGRLIRKDYFSYCRIFSEYYAPLDGKAHLYQRRFFNEDGSVAYEEITDNGDVMFQFPDRLLCSKAELVGYLVEKLGLTSKDTVIIDRTTDIGQAILEKVSPAKVGVVIHADHFSEAGTDGDNILWNNYYEYPFSQHRHLNFYIASTKAQSRLVKKQFRQYLGADPYVAAIPVGSLPELKYPEGERKKHSLVTASRLAGEKHVDWIVEAVSQARELIGDVTLDIYGKGGEESVIRDLIDRLGCKDYIRLMGQHDMSDVYKNYEAYIAGSTSEGFGLTLMEAVGSGLPIIGFDVRYGNPTFIDHNKNGYLIKVNDEMDGKVRIKKLAECIVRLFTEADLEAFHEHSYGKAKDYLNSEVGEGWRKLLKKLGTYSPVEPRKTCPPPSP